MTREPIEAPISPVDWRSRLIIRQARPGDTGGRGTLAFAAELRASQNSEWLASSQLPIQPSVHK
jgi:hypothetical protein